MSLPSQARSSKGNGRTIEGLTPAGRPYRIDSMATWLDARDHWAERLFAESDVAHQMAMRLIILHQGEDPKLDETICALQSHASEAKNATSLVERISRHFGPRLAACLKAESEEVEGRDTVEENAQSLIERLGGYVVDAWSRSRSGDPEGSGNTDTKFMTHNGFLIAERFLLGEDQPGYMAASAVKDTWLKDFITYRDREVLSFKVSRFILTKPGVRHRLADLNEKLSLTRSEIDTACTEFLNERRGRMLHDIFLHGMRTLFDPQEKDLTETYIEMGQSFKHSSDATVKDPADPYLTEARRLLRAYNRSYGVGDELSMKRFVTLSIGDSKDIEGGNGDEVHDVWLAVTRLMSMADIHFPASCRIYHF